MKKPIIFIAMAFYVFYLGFMTYGTGKLANTITQQIEKMNQQTNRRLSSIK